MKGGAGGGGYLSVDSWLEKVVSEGGRRGGRSDLLFVGVQLLVLLFLYCCLCAIALLSALVWCGRFPFGSRALLDRDA